MKLFADVGNGRGPLGVFPARTENGFRVRDCTFAQMTPHSERAKMVVALQ